MPPKKMAESSRQTKADEELAPENGGTQAQGLYHNHTQHITHTHTHTYIYILIYYIIIYIYISIPRAHNIFREIYTCLFVRTRTRRYMRLSVRMFFVTCRATMNVFTFFTWMMVFAYIQKLHFWYFCNHPEVDGIFAIFKAHLPILRVSFLMFPLASTMARCQNHTADNWRWVTDWIARCQFLGGI